MRQRWAIFFGTCGILFSTVSCDEAEEVDLKAYYFPYETFTEEVTYVYVDSYGDTARWVMHYDAPSKKFVTRIYMPNAPKEVTTERITKTGAYFDQFYKVIDDKVMEADLEEDEVFKWRLKTDETLEWYTTYFFEDHYESTSKERMIYDEEAVYNLYGKSHDAVVFEDYYWYYEEWDYDEPVELSFIQYTTYAKELGLVHMEREFEDGEYYEMRLVKITRD